jgi:hypothetical protein
VTVAALVKIVAGPKDVSPNPLTAAGDAEAVMGGAKTIASFQAPPWNMRMRESGRQEDPTRTFAELTFRQTPET